MSNSPESCVSTQDTFRVMEKEEQTSSVSALVSRLNTCSVTDYGAGEKNDDCKSGGDDCDRNKKSTADIFPWLPKINDLCRSAVGSKNIKTLENLLTVYLQKVTSSVKDCYGKPTRARNLKTCMNKTLTFFHFLYEDIKEPVDNTLYLEKMTELVAMYIDMEIKSSRRRKETTKKVISRVTSALNIFLDRSENHILDAIMRAKYITTTDKEICSPVLGKLLRTLRTYNMPDTLYVRYLLVFKLWKKIVADANMRKDINKLAISRLPPPANFADRYKRFNNVLPRMPNSKNITMFYMQAKLNIKTACKNFMKISKDPLQPVVIDKPLFFDGRIQSTFSGKGNAFDGGVSRNLMNEIWSSFSDDTSTSSKKKDSSKKKSKISLKNLMDKKKKKKIKSDSFSDSNSPRVEASGKDLADLVTSSASDLKTLTPVKIDTLLKQKMEVNLPDSTTTRAVASPDVQPPKVEFGHYLPYSGDASPNVNTPYECAVTSRLYQEDQKQFVINAAAAATNTSAVVPSGILSLLNNTKLLPMQLKQEKISSSQDSYHQNSKVLLPTPQLENTNMPRLVNIKQEGNNNLYEPPVLQESKLEVADVRALNAPILDITGPVVTMQNRTMVPVITIEDCAESEKVVSFKECDIQVGDQDLPYIEEEVVEPCPDSFSDDANDNKDGSLGMVEVNVGYEGKDDSQDDMFNIIYNGQEGSATSKAGYSVQSVDAPDRSSPANFEMVVDRKPALPLMPLGFKPITLRKNHEATAVRKSEPSPSEVSSSRSHRRRSVTETVVPTISTDICPDLSRNRLQDFASPPPADHHSLKSMVSSSSPHKSPSSSPRKSPSPRLTSPRHHTRSEPDVNVPTPVSSCQDRRTSRGITSPPPEITPPKTTQSASPQLKMLTSPKSVVIKSSKPMVLSSSLESAVMQSPQAMVFSPPPTPKPVVLPEPVPIKSPPPQAFSPPPKFVPLRYAEPAASTSYSPKSCTMQPALFASAETVAMPPPRPVVRASPDPTSSFALHETYSPSSTMAPPPCRITPLGTPSTSQYSMEMPPPAPVMLQHHHPELYAPSSHLTHAPPPANTFPSQDDFAFSNEALFFGLGDDVLPYDDDFFCDYFQGNSSHDFRHNFLVDPNVLERRPAGDEDVFKMPPSGNTGINPMDLLDARAVLDHLSRNLPDQFQPCTRWPAYNSVPTNPAAMPFMTGDEDPAAYPQYAAQGHLVGDYSSGAATSSDLSNSLPPTGLSADTSQYNSTFRNSISENCDKDDLDHSSQMSKAQKNSVSYVNSYPNENAHLSLRTQTDPRDSKSLSQIQRSSSALASSSTDEPAQSANQKTSGSHRKRSSQQTERPSLQELNFSAQPAAQVKPGDEQTASVTKVVTPRGGMFTTNVSGRPSIPFTGPTTHIPGAPYQTIPTPKQPPMCRCRRCYVRMYHHHILMLRYKALQESNRMHQQRTAVAYQYQPCAESVPPPVMEAPPPSDAEQNERIRKMVKDYEMKQAAKPPESNPEPREANPELSDAAIQRMVRDYEMGQASRRVPTTESNSAAQDEQIRKMVQEYEMRQASEGRNPVSALEAALDDLLESDSRNKSDLHSMLPPKKRHKAMHVDSPPVVESFPSYPTRPMISIAELEEERLKQHQSLLQNCARDNAKKREEIIARYKKPIKVDFSKLKPTQSVIQKNERPIERLSANPNKANQPPRCNPVHSRPPSENTNCVLNTESAGRTFKTPAQLKEHTFSNRQNIYQVNPSYNVDRQIIYPLAPTTMIVTKWIYEDKTNLKPNNPVDLLDLSYSPVEDTGSVQKGSVSKVMKSKEKASSSTRSSKRKNQTGGRMGPSDCAETKRRR